RAGTSEFHTHRPYRYLKPFKATQRALRHPPDSQLPPAPTNPPAATQGPLAALLDVTLAPFQSITTANLQAAPTLALLPRPRSLVFGDRPPAAHGVVPKRPR
ncbi:MAG: hypothetical protein ABIG44_05630, partial [Planctomycetota bacterium]